MKNKEKAKRRPDRLSKRPDVNGSFSIKRWNYLGILVLLMTFVTFLPILKAGFVNWDDQQYVYENSLITSFSHFKELITTPVQGNLHPLTMLSLAFNYFISGFNPWSYHLLNILFHLVNTFLVFILAKQKVMQS